MSYRASSDVFEMWLLGRVAEAVEAGEVSGDLLVELEGELGASCTHLPACGHASAIRSVVDLLGIDPASAGSQNGRMAAQETSREQLLRDVAEGWLAEHRKAYRRHCSPRSG
jgi:hypothetical protein